MAERIALIGAGVIGKRHLKAIGETNSVELVAIVDPDPAAAVVAESIKVPHFAQSGEMLASLAPAGVVVATPTEVHLEPTLEALEAGCGVLIEKPIAASVEEAQIIDARASDLDLPVLVGHHRRYYPQVEKAREIVRSGALGQLVAVSGIWCLRKHQGYYLPEWRKRWQAGPILTNLIHEIDYLRYIVGEVSSVTGEIGNPVQGFEKEDVAGFVLRFAQGALGSFILSDQADSPWTWEFGTGENPDFAKTGQNSIRFVGTEGALEFPNLRLWTSEGEQADWTTPKKMRDFPLELGDAYIGQIDHFAAVISERETPKISAADARETLKATLAVLESAAKGERILLNP